MNEHATVRLDNGGVNRRILARETIADYRRVEQASIKQRTDLRSPEGKRLFARFFHSLQLNAYFVSSIARVLLSREDAQSVEKTLRKRLDELMAQINEGIDGAHALFTANGITRAATYDTVALNLEVGIISSFGRRYLEAIQALDRLMPMLRTLEIYEVITEQQFDEQRTGYKKSARRVAAAARELATGLRRRMNELADKEMGGDHGGNANAAAFAGQAPTSGVVDAGREASGCAPRDEIAFADTQLSAPPRVSDETSVATAAKPGAATMPADSTEERRAA